MWIVAIATIISIGTINAYNFMDGINGITVAYSLTVLGLLAYVNTKILFIDPEFIWYVMLSCLVFGFFNFRQKAKSFAGDVGSVAIAFIILFLLVKLMVTTGNIIYILFLTVYGVDTVLTIIRRALKRENVFKAHRSHLYQYLANENKTDKLFVAALYAVLQLLVGGVVIWVAMQTVTTQYVVTAVMLLVLCAVYFYTKNSLIKKHNL